MSNYGAQAIGASAKETLEEELELVREVYPSFDSKAYLACGILFVEQEDLVELLGKHKSDGEALHVSRRFLRDIYQSHAGP